MAQPISSTPNTAKNVHSWKDPV